MHEFECQNASSKTRIQNSVDHFKSYGTVESLNAASKTQDSAKPLRTSQEAYSRADREREKVCPAESETLRETCRRVLVNDMKAYPYMRRFWFQQDGASSHTSKMSRDWLKENFGRRAISLKADFEWAPHSPDLSPPDFLL